MHLRSQMSLSSALSMPIRVFLVALCGIAVLLWVWYIIWGRRIIFRVLVATDDNNVKLVRPDGDVQVNNFVLIFGWSGAKMRHLRRLQDAYKAKGIVSISYIAPSVIHLDRGISPQMVLPMLKMLHDEMDSLPEDLRKTATIALHTHSFLAPCLALLHILRFFPQPTPYAPNLGYLLTHISGIVYESPLPIEGLRHLKLPIEFRHQVSETLAPTTALATPPPIFGENIQLNMSLEDMQNPLYILYHAYHLAVYVTGLVLHPTITFHLFWTPVIMAVFVYYYTYNRFCKPVRHLLSLVGLTRAEDVRARYSSFTVELGPNYTQEVFSRAYEPTDDFLSDCCADAEGVAPTRSPGGSGVAGAPAGSLRDVRQLISYPRLLQTFLRDPYPIPELFIIGKEDQRVPQLDIERIMYSHVRKGLLVHKTIFDAGGHCALLLRNGNDYVADVLGFTEVMNARKRIELVALERRRW